jgi:hypothetical protein
MLHNNIYNTLKEIGNKIAQYPSQTPNPNSQFQRRTYLSSQIHITKLLPHTSQQKFTSIKRRDQELNTHPLNPTTQLLKRIQHIKPHPKKRIPLPIPLHPINHTRPRSMRLIPSNPQ